VRANAKLGNAGFLAKAPQNVVDEEKNKLALAQDMLSKLRERLDTLS
jgi:valyl-tRNA synthetase